MKVKCNKCGYVGDPSEFPQGRDFFQKSFIAECPKCDNRQNPGGASMRMMPNVDHPFTYIRSKSADDPISSTFHNASEAS